MLLSIEGLRIEPRHSSAAAPLLEDVTLALETGEVVGVIGESGAGKSTLGLAALGYVRDGCRRAAGRVLFEGRDLFKMRRTEVRRLRARHLAFVAQSAAAAFNPAHRLITQICEVPVREGLLRVAEAKREAVTLFGRLGIPEPERFGERYPHEVSGGQLQRAMIAMALISRPKLIVLDEPTTALDVTTQIDVLAHLRSLIREERLSALYISHDIALVFQLASRICVLRHGKMVESGLAEAIVAEPASPYTRTLLGAQRRAAVDTAAAPKGSASLLLIEKLSSRYGKGPLVLAELDLALAKGQTLAVVGESGSGKTSLARVITGLLPKCAGAIRYKGRELGVITSRSRDLCREIQLVHQLPDVALNPRQRIREAIGRPATLFRGMRGRACARRVEALLEIVGLSACLAGRYPHELSGGQKQRVCIARALAAEPELLICDEITASLDAVVAAEILDMLAALQRRIGLACLVITHDFGVVRAMADRIAVLRGGRLIEEGTAASVLGAPHTAYTARLLSAVPELRAGWLDDAISVLARPAPMELESTGG